jgi:hypothetical protein
MPSYRKEVIDMRSGDTLKLSYALHHLAMAENVYNDIRYIKDEVSLEAINDLHDGMYVIAQMIADDMNLSMKLHNDNKNKESA